MEGSARKTETVTTLDRPPVRELPRPGSALCRGLQEDHSSALDDTLIDDERIPGPPPDEITYRIARTTDQKEKAFRLVYNSYIRAGLIAPNPYGMRVTPYHLLSSTAIFVAEYGDQVICTVSLIGDGQRGVPMSSIFGDEVQALRDAGHRFGEVSCLADRRQELVRGLPVFVRLTRLMAQYARRQGMDQFIIAVHPRHVRFYRRFMFFEAFGSERLYPSVQDRPAVACNLDFHRADRERPPCYDQFFGAQLPEEQLLPSPMTARETRYFQPASEYAGCCLAVGSA